MSEDIYCHPELGFEFRTKQRRPRALDRGEDSA